MMIKKPLPGAYVELAWRDGNAKLPSFSKQMADSVRFAENATDDARALAESALTIWHKSPISAPFSRGAMAVRESIKGSTLWHDTVATVGKQRVRH